MPTVIAAAIAAPLITAAVVGATAVTIGTVSAIRSGREQAHLGRQAAAEQTVARAEQKKQADVSNLRARRGAARRAIAARSTAVAAGATEGGVVSTATAGAAGSAITQGAVNLSFLDTMSQSQDRELASNVRSDAIFGKIQASKNREAMFQAGVQGVRTVAGYGAAAYAEG